MFTLTFYKPDQAGLLNKTGLPSGGFEYHTIDQARKGAKKALEEYSDIELVHINKPGQDHAVEVVRRNDRRLH